MRLVHTADGVYVCPYKGHIFICFSNITQALAGNTGVFAAVHYLGSLSRTAGNSQRGINIINVYSPFLITLGPSFLVTEACMRLEVVPMKMHNSVFKCTASFFTFVL